MIRNKLSIVIYVIIGLAIVGLLSQLFTNTTSFFKNILIMLSVGLILFIVVKFFRNRKISTDMKKYKQAVQQSQLKYKQNNSGHSAIIKRKQPNKLKGNRSKRATHLRVIDGKKTK